MEEQLQTDLSNRKQIVRDEVQIPLLLCMFCAALTWINTLRKSLGASQPGHTGGEIPGEPRTRGEGACCSRCICSAG